MKTIEVPGHGEVDFPDEMSDDEIAGVLRQQTAPKPVDVSPNMTKAMQGELAGQGWVGKNLAAFGLAARNPYESAKQLIGKYLPSAGVQADQQAIEGSREIERQAPVGAIGGQVAVGTILPGGNLLKAGLTGAAMGAAQPTMGDENRAVNAAVGGLAGGAGYGAVKGLGRVLAPQTNPAAQTLAAEGVRLTPGQIMGGAAQRIEDAATSLPFAGDVIRSAKIRATEDLNRAAYNRVLAPLGLSVGKNASVGREGVAKLGETVSQAYDDILPKLTVRGDQQFGNDLLNLRQMAQSMHPERAKQFDAILKNDVLGKFTPYGQMTGGQMKQVDAKLGLLRRNYASSADGDQRQLGQAIGEVQRAMRDMVARGNPQHADRLKAINEAYANLVRVENAAGSLGAHEGVFSGAQITNAVKRGDSTVRKRGFAKGEALMQDLAEAGKTVLGQKVPDSGTPYRMVNMAALGGAPFLPPEALAATGALAAAYTPPAQAALRAALMSRPAAMRVAGEAVGNNAWLAAPIGAALALPYTR